MKMKELAEVIKSHLQKWEKDPAINVKSLDGHSRYYRANSWYSGGPKLSVKYVCYQHTANLSKEEAEHYVKKLQAGFVGTHWQAALDAASKRETEGQ